MAHEWSERIDMLSRTVVQPEHPSLSNEETHNAVKALNVYTKVVRARRDPPISNQTIALFSFTPAVGATPNQNGLYGIAKVRGVWDSEETANDFAETLIQTSDSANPILHVQVGHDFPLVQDNTLLVKETELVKVVQDELKESERAETKKQRKETKNIKEREKKLLDHHNQVMNDDVQEDDLDVYIQAHTKRAQLLWTYKDTIRRIREEICPAVQKAKQDVEALDKKFPEFRTQYYERYMDARREVGIKDDLVFGEKGAVGWMKYLLEDEDVDEMFK
jgi:hypothetical protein